MGLLALLDDIFLLKNLESEELVVLLAAHQAHFGIGAFADYAFEGEVVDPNFVHGFSFKYYCD